MKYKFRGLTEAGRWVYGCYLHTDRGGKTQCKDWIYSEPHIMRSNVFDKHEVRPETVGMWTMRDDKNDKNIFTGDKIQDRHGTKGFVYFDEDWSRFRCNTINGNHELIGTDWEVIGNKWEQGK